jgi:amino acid transporter
MNEPVAVGAASSAVRRSLGRFDLICIGLNAIVGSGVFALPDDMYREMGALSPLAFLACAIGLLPVALCYGEAASRVDRNGGPYVYASQAFGPMVGFGVGWMSFANSIFSFAAVASIAAAYVGDLVPALSATGPTRLVAAAVIVLFGALNYRGAKPGARAVDLFTIGKFAVLFVLLAALAPQVSFEGTSSELPHGAGGIGAAIFFAVFAAQGFEVVPITAGESHAPQRNVPLAVIGSLLGASLLYVVVQCVLIGSFSELGRVSHSTLLGVVVAVGGIISTLGFVSGSALGTPRYLHAAAVDGHLYGRLGEVHPHFASPHLAVVVTSVLAALLVLALDYRALIGISNVAVAVQYLSTCLAVPRLRRLEGRAPLHLAGGPILPLIGAAVSVWIFTAATPLELGWAAGSLAVGVLLTLATRKLGARR